MWGRSVSHTGCKTERADLHSKLYRLHPTYHHNELAVRDTLVRDRPCYSGLVH
jgi:hypothetical protein